MSDIAERADDELYDVAEVARRLKVSTEHIRREVRAGHLEHIRLGPKAIRIRPSQLDAYIAARECA